MESAPAGLDLVADYPLAVLEQGLEPVGHVSDAVLHSLPSDPRFASKPIQKGEYSSNLALCEASNLEHDGISVLAESHIEKELAEICACLNKPLVHDLSNRLASVDMIVPIVIVVRVFGLFVLCPSVIPCFLCVSVEADLPFTLGFRSYFLNLCFFAICPCFFHSEDSLILWLWFVLLIPLFFA